jgi:twinkle protein
MTTTPVDREYPETHFVAHEPCPKCGSGDNLARFNDGHAYCFGQGCGYREKPDGEGSPYTTLQDSSKARRKEGLLEGEVPAEGIRGLTAETCKRWGYLINRERGCHVAQYRDQAGRVVAQKLRGRDKSFKFVGSPKEVGLFGDHLWGPSKKIVVTEGEIDAMSVSQVQNHKWPVVSIPNGASGARKSLAKTLDYFDSFGEVILMFDSDDPGYAAAAECAELFPPGKIKIVSLPLKDANEMLQAGRGHEIVSAIWNARPWRPDGIMAATDLREAIRVDSAAESIDYPFHELTRLTRGLRRGELVTVAAGSGTGKSAFVREIAYHLHLMGEQVGMIMLEESTKRTLEGLVGIHMNKPLHMTREDVSEESIVTAFDDLFQDHEIYLYDHFGSTHVDSLLSKIRYMSKALDCRWVVLDHLSIVVSGLDVPDERKAIDIAMTALRTLVQETGIGLILVSHLRRPQGDKGHEEGTRTALTQLRGSHSIAQLSDIVVGLERDQQSEDHDLTTIRVLKNRFTGETGEAGFIRYSKETGRLTEESSGFVDESGIDTPPWEDF